jgi:hypothetical protein
VHERPRLLTDLPPELAALIEDVTIDSNGQAIPKLYSKMQASKELRAMLNIGKPVDAADISRLSDAELVAQLAEQAKELGIEIDLNYRFLKQLAIPETTVRKTEAETETSAEKAHERKAKRAKNKEIAP